MKYTMLYLKYVVLALLMTITLCGIGMGAILVLGGLIMALSYLDTVYLMVVPLGLFSGFMGFVTIDAFEWINNRWES